MNAIEQELTSEARDRLDNFFKIVKGLGIVLIFCSVVMIFYGTLMSLVQLREAAQKKIMLKNLATCSNKVVYQPDSYPYVYQSGKKVWLYQEGCK